jgi:hypothetical protein
MHADSLHGSVQEPRRERPTIDLDGDGPLGLGKAHVRQALGQLSVANIRPLKLRFDMALGVRLPVVLGVGSGTRLRRPYSSRTVQASSGLR